LTAKLSRRVTNLSQFGGRLNAAAPKTTNRTRGAAFSLGILANSGATF
jgi:hypothetical protein